MSILTFRVNGEEVNLIKDYEWILMSTVTVGSNPQTNVTTPTSVAEARPYMDSCMMFKCLRNNINNKVHHQIMSILHDIKRDGSTMFAKEIVGNEIGELIINVFGDRFGFLGLNVTTGYDYKSLSFIPKEYGHVKIKEHPLVVSVEPYVKWLISALLGHRVTWKRR